jgi:hypothetical protein
MEGDEEVDRLCANLEELDNEGDTVGRVLQMLNNGSDFLLSITLESIPDKIVAIVVPM